jgi:hypothetical protein
MVKEIHPLSQLINSEPTSEYEISIPHSGKYEDDSLL